MSVVVGIKQNGVVYMGCDSQVTMGGTRTTLKNPNNYKIWKVRDVEDCCIMGSVGDLRDACVVRTMNGLISDYNLFKGHVSFDFVVNKIVPDIIDRLKEFNYIKNDKSSVFEGMDSSFLFSCKDMLFLIGSDGSVIEIDDCVAIGSGKNEAIGSLLSTDGEDPVQRIIKAIKASAANDIYVDYPIILIDTETMEFRVITEKDEPRFLKPKKSKTIEERNI